MSDRIPRKSLVGLGAVLAIALACRIGCSFRNGEDNDTFARDSILRKIENAEISLERFRRDSIRHDSIRQRNKVRRDSAKAEREKASQRKSGKGRGATRPNPEERMFLDEPVGSGTHQ